MQLLLKDLKAVGIDAKLDQKEYGAYQATCRVGKFDSMVYGPLTPFVEPDSFLYGQYYTGEPRNRSHVNDPALDDLLVRQRRTSDLKARREVINQIERHLAKQQYYVQCAVGHLHRRLGPGAQELRAERRLRLRRAAHHRLARPVTRRHYAFGMSGAH